jgi:hypothetical protein
MNHAAFADFLGISCETTSRLAVDVLRLSCARVTDRNIVRMLITAPRNEADRLSLEFFEDSFCCQCLAHACCLVNDEGTREDKWVYRRARHYFLDVVPRLSTEGRQILETTFRATMSGLRESAERSLDTDEDHVVGVAR